MENDHKKKIMLEWASQSESGHALRSPGELLTGIRMAMSISFKVNKELLLDFS